MNPIKNTVVAMVAMGLLVAGLALRLGVPSLLLLVAGIVVEAIVQMRNRSGFVAVEMSVAGFVALCFGVAGHGMYSYALCVAGGLLTYFSMVPLGQKTATVSSGLD